MRSFKRAVVVSAMALPLALGSAGIASAESSDGHKENEGHKCSQNSCHSDSWNGHENGHKNGHKYENGHGYKKDDEGYKCVHNSCHADVEKHETNEKNDNWVWNWKHYSAEYDTSIINAGIIG